MLDGMLLGLETAFTFQNLFFCCIRLFHRYDNRDAPRTRTDVGGGNHDSSKSSDR